MRNLDLVVLAAALPVFALAGLPLVGYVAIAVAWVVQHLIARYAGTRAGDALARGDRRFALGAIGASILVRLWVVTGTILAVGLAAEREDGLAAALLALVLITFHLGSVAMMRVLHPEEQAL